MSCKPFTPYVQILLSLQAVVWFTNNALCMQALTSRLVASYRMINTMRPKVKQLLLGRQQKQQPMWMRRRMTQLERLVLVAARWLHRARRGRAQACSKVTQMRNRMRWLDHVALAASSGLHRWALGREGQNEGKAQARAEGRQIVTKYLPWLHHLRMTVATCSRPERRQKSC